MQQGTRKATARQVLTLTRRVARTMDKIVVENSGILTVSRLGKTWFSAYNSERTRKRAAEVIAEQLLASDPSRTAISRFTKLAQSQLWLTAQDAIAIVNTIRPQLKGNI
jgi:hypothetical protein